LIYILRRCHSTVRTHRNSCAPISAFVRPSLASLAMYASGEVSAVVVAIVSLRTVSPVAASSRRARWSLPADLVQHGDDGMFALLDTPGALPTEGAQDGPHLDLPGPLGGLGLPGAIG
jgi:hypothetical protein